MKSYDCVIFDLGNVILGFDYNISVKKFIEISDTNLDKAYDLFFDSDLTRLHDRGEISSLKFYSEIKKELNLDISFKDFSEIWNNIFFENKSVSNLIKKVKKNHRIMLLSNTNKMHYDFIRKKFKIVKEFDEVILSYEAHALKPESAIYRLAIKKSKTSPERIFYTDDRPDLVDGAKSHGIDAIVFKDYETLEQILTKKNIL